MTEIRIVRDYPHPPAQVWRAVTDPELVPRWTATGQGGRPVGFAAEVGTRFQFVAKPRPGWRGIVDCEVLEVREPSLLRFSWVGDEGGAATYVTYRIEPNAGGTGYYRTTWTAAQLAALPLAQLSPAGPNRFEGKTSAGQDVALSR